MQSELDQVKIVIACVSCFLYDPRDHENNHRSESAYMVSATIICVNALRHGVFYFVFTFRPPWLGKLAT